MAGFVAQPRPPGALVLKIFFDEKYQKERRIYAYRGFVPLALKGGLVPNKISGVGTNFGLLVHVLPGPIKQRACKPRMLLS